MVPQPDRSEPATRRRYPGAADVAVALAAAGILVLVTRHIPVGPAERALDEVGYGLLLAAGAAVALCRSLPAVALGVMTGALATYIVRDYAGGPIFVAGWAALAALGWRRGRRAAVTGAALLAGVLLAAAELEGSAPPLLYVGVVGWTTAAVLVGDVLRARRERVVQLEERARHLERSREEEARRRVAEERLRIARDLHDGVAHAMTTINVQAGAAAHVVDRRPEAAREALAAIQRASSDVLDELAALLGVLRDVDEPPDRSPTPDLAQVDELVASARAARLPVTLTIRGGVDGVSAPVGTAAYRIVQESLTNVIRHAGPASADVRVEADGGGGLTLAVSDDGTGVDAGRAGVAEGMGIRGMRERAEATGGTLSAGPGPSGGFVVRATWPAGR